MMEVCMNLNDPCVCGSNKYALRLKRKLQAAHTHINITVHPHTRAPSGKGWLLCDTQRVAGSTQIVEGKKQLP